jgi:16S rRNA (guanine966-N2)-methyltransferase
LRIVGGRWAGRDLVSPSGRVRPTSEEVREAWLATLEAEVRGARILDLFAGSGALGLEALSRGAAAADFVENGASALHALKSNIAKLRARSLTRVFVKDAFEFLSRVPDFGYEVAFADPPYTSTLSTRTVELWKARPFAGVLGVEHAAEVKLPKGGVTTRVGEQAFTLYRARRPGR